MKKYKIYCAECKHKYIISHEEFSKLVETIEEATKKITSILAGMGVPVAYKSFLHTALILEYGLMRCCYEPEIYFSEIDENDSNPNVIIGDMEKLENLIDECMSELESR